jgi:hypothetical protein
VEQGFGVLQIAVEQGFGVLQIAVEQGFGGEDSAEKAVWMIDTVVNFFRENGYFTILNV